MYKFGENFSERVDVPFGYAVMGMLKTKTMIFPWDPPTPCAILRYKGPVRIHERWPPASRKRDAVRALSMAEPNTA